MQHRNPSTLVDTFWRCFQISRAASLYFSSVVLFDAIIGAEPTTAPMRETMSLEPCLGFIIVRHRSSVHAPAADIGTFNRPAAIDLVIALCIWLDICWKIFKTKCHCSKWGQIIK